MNSFLIYTKKFFPKKDTQKDEPEKKEIISDLRRAKNELETAMTNFVFATDPVLIDLYSYQIKAAEVKYNYHLTRAKHLAP